MTIFPTIRTAQSDLFSNSSGERLAEIGRRGGGVPPRFLGDTFDLAPKTGPAFHPDALARSNGQ